MTGSPVHPGLLCITVNIRCSKQHDECRYYRVATSDHTSKNRAASERVLNYRCAMDFDSSFIKSVTVKMEEQ
jgi:hypothetical protein